MKSKEKINAELESLFYIQIIEEAVDADDNENHQRKMMRIGDCIHAHETAEIWERYSEMC